MKFVFVYNADSGIFSAITDFAHKIIRPETYSCQLCLLTYGDFRMKTEWREFLSRLPGALEFYHRDDFREKYPNLNSVNLPAIFRETGNELQLLLSSYEIDRAPDLGSLMRIMKEKIQ